MRILLLSSQSPLPITDGIRLRTYHLFSSLAKDHEITLLTFYNSLEDMEGLRQLDLHPAKVGALRGVNRSSLLDYIKGSISPTPFFVGRIWSAEMQAALANELRSSDYDLLFVNDLRMANYAKPYSFLPRVIDACDALSLLFRRAFHTARGLRERISFFQLWLKTQRYESTMYRHFDLCTVVSSVDAGELRRISPGVRVEVVPNGVDADYFRPGDPGKEEQNTLVFVGVMDYPPNVDAVRYFATEVLPLVRERIPSARFLVVGRNGNAKTLRLNNLRNVEVLGTVPDVRPFVQQSSIFVCPMRFGSGVKNKVLEAMSMAKPVVGTPLAFEGLDIVDNEHAVSKPDSRGLADSIISLLSDEKRRVELGAKAREFVQGRYSWQTASSRLSALLHNVCCERVDRSLLPAAVSQSLQ